MGPNDIVIHYRDGSSESPNHGIDSTVPKVAYFTHIIDLHLKKQTGVSIHYLTEPRWRSNHHVVDTLKAKYGQRFRVSQGSPEQDLSMGMRAPILIICAETFGWLMAYLTLARNI
jgi:hypothetical protein